MTSAPQEVLVTDQNVDQWPKVKRLFDAGKVRADSTGRLRYLHGAPVGRMILVRYDQSGSPIYRESADEWFDPESPKAESFSWS